MFDAIILQQANSGSEYANMLRLAYSRHCEYALKHKMDLQVIMSDIPRNVKPFGAWAKLFLIRDALLAGYEYVFWVDADALIYDMATDLRQAFTEQAGDILACQHPNPVHLNVGVLFVRNTERANEFMQAWLDQMHRPNEDGWHEQGIFNRMMTEEKWVGVVARMHDKWNATQYANTLVPNSVIRGYHGAANVTALMRFQAMQSDYAALPR